MPTKFQKKNANETKRLKSKKTMISKVNDLKW